MLAYLFTWATVQQPCRSVVELKSNHNYDDRRTRKLLFQHEKLDVSVWYVEQERGGSSRVAVLKYIVKKYQLGADEKLVNAHLKMALRAGIKNGSLKHSKGTGAAGSFRIGAAAEKQTKPGKKPKAAGAKKPKAAKKSKAATGAGSATKTTNKPKKAGEGGKVKKPKVAKKPKSPTKTAKPTAAKKPIAAKAAKAQKSSAAKPKKAAARKWTEDICS